MSKQKKPKPEISAFFPAYNEEENIAAMIKNADKVLRNICSRYEIIVSYDPGTTDRTADIVRKLMNTYPAVRMVSRPKSMKGYGCALRYGYKAAKLEWVFYTDADNQFDMTDLYSFLPFMDRYKFISGYRKERKDPKMRLIIAFWYNVLINIFFHTRLRDIDCAFKLIHRDVLKKMTLKSRTGVIDTEIVVKAQRAGFAIKELPVAHFNRQAGTSFVETRGALPKWSIVRNLLRELYFLYKDV